MEEALVVSEGSAGSVLTVLDKVDDPVNFGLTHAVFYFFFLFFFLLPTYSLLKRKEPREKEMQVRA